MKKNMVAILSAIVAVLLSAGCCRCGAKHDVPKIEPMEVAKLEPPSPRTRAVPSGEAKVWDFTAGLPKGGRLLKGAICDAKGLYARSPTNRNVACGFRLDERWTPQEAFLFEADVQVPLVSFSPPPESDHTAEVDEMEAAREGDERTRKGTLRAKAKMLAQVAEVGRLLGSGYTPDADSSSPEIVVYNHRGVAPRRGAHV